MYMHFLMRMYMRKQGINGQLITELEHSVFFNWEIFELLTNPDFLPVMAFGSGPPKIKKPVLFYPAPSLHCRRKLHFTFSKWGAANNSGAFGVGGEKK